MISPSSAVRSTASTPQRRLQCWHHPRVDCVALLSATLHPRRWGRVRVEGGRAGSWRGGPASGRRSSPLSPSVHSLPPPSQLSHSGPSLRPPAGPWQLPSSVSRVAPCERPSAWFLAVRSHLRRIGARHHRRILRRITLLGLPGLPLAKGLPTIFLFPVRWAAFGSCVRSRSLLRSRSPQSGPLPDISHLAHPHRHHDHLRPLSTTAWLCPREAPP